MSISTDELKTALKNTLDAAVTIREHRIREARKLIDEGKLNEAYIVLQKLSYQCSDIESLAYDWYVIPESATK